CDALTRIGELVSRSWERAPRRLEGIGGIAGHAQNVLRALVVRGELGIAHRPIHAETIETRGAEGVVGKPMGLPLIVQRSAAKPEDAFVSKGRAMRRLELGTWRARRTKVRITLVQRHTVLENQARVTTRGDLRVTKRSWTELPVRVVHREVTARIEATPALEQEDAHTSFGEAHRREAAAGAGAHDDRIERLRSRGDHGRDL